MAGILWLSFVLLLFSSFANWGYAYRAHRRFGSALRDAAFEILNARAV